MQGEYRRPGISPRQFISDWWWLIVLCCAKLFIQLAVAENYGFHRDEFLYLAQGRHLAWGYMENPPLTGLVSAFIQLFGTSIIWVKFLPALTGAAALPLLVIITRNMGGGRWAQVTACIVYLTVPAFLRTHHMLQPVFLNQFIWLLLTVGIVRLIVSENPRWWYFIGIVIGTGMLTKYSIVFPVIGFSVGILLTHERKWLARREPYIAALIALLIFLPNLMWQYHHDFPVVKHMQELRATQLVNVDSKAFLTSQFLIMFAASLFWPPGVVAVFRKQLGRFRLLGWAYIVLIGLLLLARGKAYYSLGIYPVFIVAGAVWWESVIGQRRLLKITLPVLAVLISLPTIPYGIPVLPIDKMERYGIWMKDHAGLTGPLVWEDGVARSLPQDYADMYGWEEMVANVSEFYHGLNDTLRQKIILWGGSYGHAGALQYYGPKYSLPDSVDVLSFNGSFALWVPDSLNIEGQIIVEECKQGPSRFFAVSELVDSNSNRYARDKGYIYWRTEPQVNIDSAWNVLLSEYKYRWSRK